MPTVIFDLDGTLIDSAPGILEAFARVLARYGLTPMVPLESALIGPPLGATLRRMVGDGAGIDVDTLAAAFREIYDKGLCLKVDVYPGVERLLCDLRADGARLFIATNKRAQPTRQVLEHLGWAALFERVCALDAWRPRVADKGAMLRGLIADAAIDAKSAFFVGDTVEDSAAAAEAGLAFIGVAWGYGRLAVTSDTVVCGNLAELRRQLPGFGLRRRPTFHDH